MSNMTYVDREEASKILKVSTRTVDRYIRKHRFKTRKDGRRVFIKRVDVDKIIEEHIGQFVDTENAAENKVKIKEMSLQIKEAKPEQEEARASKSSQEEKVYKELYKDTKNELKEKQERLEVATYRVGQLEAQLKNMVPVLDYTRKEKELKEAQITMEQREAESKGEIRKMERRLQNERVTKWLYLSLAGFLLVVEPILFLVWAFS